MANLVNLDKLRSNASKHTEVSGDTQSAASPAGGLGDPPRTFNAAKRAIWNEFRERGEWLTEADRMMAEIACELMHRFRNEPDEFNAPLFGRLEKVLARLGMSPNDRTKVTSKRKVDGSNPFAGNRKKKEA